VRKLFVTAAIAVVGTALLVASASAGSSTAAQGSQNIPAVASSSKQFSTLVSLLKQAGLVGALSKGTYTVFAPTNAAFAKVPKATLDQLAADPALLKTVLTYHVVKGNVPAAKVVKLNGKSVNTLAGQPVKVRIASGKVFLNGRTQVTKADVMASNGVIHVINKVLIPSA
jgi:uncharacterized surface protein with fasciclin (FAS1) repeats